MENISIKNSFNEMFFCLFIGLSFLYGILSYQHYSPSFHDFYIHTIVFALCSIGLSFFYMKKNIKIYLNNFLWFILAIIFIVQPVLNKIIYVDGLIFPLAVTFLTFFLSVAISNMVDKDGITKIIAFILICGSVLLLFTQISHILNIEFIVKAMQIPLQLGRFSGNLFQPNQTAFVFILGVISLMYFCNNKNNILKYILIFILSVGVAFTVSRSGFLMLLLCSFVFNLLLNYFNKISLLKLKDFFICLVGFLFGVLIYPNFSSGTILERVIGGDNVRISLLHQSWLIIFEHPITGVGWKNFAGSGLAYFEKIEFLNSADHSHFFFTQLWSEFGILGLLVVFLFFYIFIKNVKILNVRESYVFVVLSIFIIYSCFEFPLWQLRFLIIFSIFLSLYDRTSKSFYIINRGYYVSIILIGFVCLSLYYSYKYSEVARVYDFVVNKNNNLADKVKKLDEINSIFGFGFFDDILIYEVISEGDFNLKVKIDIGNRLVHYLPSYPYLVRHGTSLALSGDEKGATYYFEATCRYSYGSHCEEVKKYLQVLSDQNPDYFKNIYNTVEKKYKK
ncbi:Wzy polymerase domain-containing protein [Acinetobacter sp. Z1]|uniref:PglL family O-oligosaccharyltransferase n=1 Tax=Acinetobacter sp. Z1 TaxID=2953738 RepID=UPI0020C98B9E|nr:Wzy polymerase domain-containing protein [Acinetobacter sp. Z1]UTO19846.1 Wzy polymerase domain-containing protein [Acinetobacter sp. Z1]